MTAGFLLKCQNSLWWEICLICHWNIDSWKEKLSFWYVMVLKNNKRMSRYIQHRLHLMKTIIVSGAILVKIKNFSTKNA